MIDLILFAFAVLLAIIHNRPKERAVRWAYMFAAIVSLSTAAASAQQLQVTAPKTQVYPGEQVAVTYTLSGTSNLSALQWDGPKIMATTSVAGKSIDCNLANGRCILWGGITVLANGTVASQVVTAPTGVGTTLTVQPAAVVAAKPDGTAGVLTAGPAITLTVIPFKEDLNGDGTITVDDVLLAVQQAKGMVACGNADINGDGACNVLDVQLVSNKAQ